MRVWPFFKVALLFFFTLALFFSLPINATAFRASDLTQYWDSSLGRHPRPFFPSGVCLLLGTDFTIDLQFWVGRHVLGFCPFSHLFLHPRQNCSPIRLSRSATSSSPLLGSSRHFCPYIAPRSSTFSSRGDCRSVQYECRLHGGFPTALLGFRVEVVRSFVEGACQ